MMTEFSLNFYQSDTQNWATVLIYPQRMLEYKLFEPGFLHIGLNIFFNVIKVL